jgi:hypothetical protein
MSEWDQARCARATLETFRKIGADPANHTEAFLTIAQILHVVATGQSADMDQACACAIAADEITGGSKRHRTHPTVVCETSAKRLKG